MKKRKKQIIKKRERKKEKKSSMNRSRAIVLEYEHELVFFNQEFLIDLPHEHICTRKIYRLCLAIDYCKTKMCILIHGDDFWIWRDNKCRWEQHSQGKTCWLINGLVFSAQRLVVKDKTEYDLVYNHREYNIYKYIYNMHNCCWWLVYLERYCFVCYFYDIKFWIA